MSDRGQVINVIVIVNIKVIDNVDVDV